MLPYWEKVFREKLLSLNKILLILSHNFHLFESFVGENVFYLSKILSIFINEVFQNKYSECEKKIRRVKLSPL